MSLNGDTAPHILPKILINNVKSKCISNKEFRTPLLEQFISNIVRTGTSGVPQSLYKKAAKLWRSAESNR